MRKIAGQFARQAGLPPGTLVAARGKRVEKPVISVMDYDRSGVRAETAASAAACRSFVGKSTVTWINLTGLETQPLQELGEVFGIHPLVLEDIANTEQRPKIEHHGEYLFIVAKMLYQSAASGEIVSEQVSLILGQGYLITFQEVEGDVFDLIRRRIHEGIGRIRGMGADYLAYALLDAIVDNYFVVLEDVGDRIELIQERVLREPEPELLQQIHGLRRDMIFMRKLVWPLREVLSRLEKEDGRFLAAELDPYLRDLYEHTVQVAEGVEALRDLLTGSLEMYMSTVSNRMNEVMRVLTVIATVFIPLTFIVGVYGMNFEHMPELGWRYGYAAVWAVMLLLTAGMVMFFRRRNWL